MIKVKICGVKTLDVLTAAVEGGADFIGFMFYSKSPRLIDLAEAKVLREKLPAHIKAAAVVVDGTDEQLADLTTHLRPDFIQAHGAETPSRVAEIKARFGVGVIKALGVSTPADIKKYEAYGAADWILFDNVKGGSGQKFNWEWLSAHTPKEQFILAGGLHSSNLSQAIEASGARFVDVSSGVEVGGNKDAALVKTFLAKAKTL